MSGSNWLPSTRQIGLGRHLVGAAEPTRVVELGRLPRPQPGRDLRGELRRVRGSAEGLRGDVRRRLVVLPATLRVVPDEADDDVRADRADPVDVVLEDLLAIPALERLVTAEGVPEVHRAREVLLGAVHAVRGEQFLGAEDGERLEDLGPDLVLAAIAARGGDQRRPHAVLVPVARQQRRVLVVGVRRRHHQAADRAQLPQHEPERRVVGMLRDGLEAVLRVRRDGQREQQRRAGDAGQ